MHSHHLGTALAAVPLLAFAAAAPAAPARPAAAPTSVGVATPRTAEAGDRAGARADERVEVHWQRKRFDPTAPPAELAEPQRLALADWASLARDLGYRMDLDADGRSLLLTPVEDARSVRRRTKAIEEALEAFDEELPWSAPSWDPRAASEQIVRGHLVEADPTPVVLVVLRDDRELDHLLDLCVARDGDLAGWAAGASGTVGFDLPQLDLVARLAEPAWAQEWRVENELVHGLVEGLLRQRFGVLPHWLEQGVAWRVERESCGDLYSFPGRAGFVAIDAHDGWDEHLQDEFRQREDAHVRVDDLVEWRGNAWDEPLAAQAWGLVDFLAEHREGALSRVAADLALHQELESLDVRSDGSWVRRPGVEVPVRVQREVLQAHAGVDALSECAERFRKGRRYRPSRRR